MAHPWPLVKTLMYISAAPLEMGAHHPTVNFKICLVVSEVKQAEGCHAKVHVKQAAPHTKM